MATPTGNVTPTTIRAIAQAIRDRLVTHASVGEDQVIITSLPPEDVPTLTTDYDFVFAIGGESPDVKVIDGAGRTVNKRTREVSLSVRSRLLLDTIGSDETHLLDAGEGHTGREDAVCNALEIFLPTDAAGNALVTTPIRLGRLGKAKRMKQSEWIISTWEMELPYIRSLDSSIV